MSGAVDSSSRSLTKNAVNQIGGRLFLSLGRLAAALGLDAWAAHSAGLFEECGKAILFRHSSGRYRALLRVADRVQKHFFNGGALTLRSDAGVLTLTEAGSKRRASLHVLRGGVESVDPGGIEPLGTDVAGFARALSSCGISSTGAARPARVA